MLHNDRNLFEQVILRVADEMGIEPSIVEKDYYVSIFLERIVEKQPAIIFKGGTSLSKCHKLINRFSEDIDLNIDTETKPTEGQRRKLKEHIVAITEELGFQLTNPDDVRSRRDYNRYVIDYPSVFASAYLKQHLIVETAVYIRAYPHKQMMASSLIYDYLLEKGFTDIIAQYGLHPFEVNVQTAERTLIDKVYALGDYYLSDAIREHSRHLYDIYKLLEVVSLDSNIKELVREVYQERAAHPNCRSAKPGVDMQVLLQKLINKDVYKADYEDITVKILFETVDYRTAISALQKIIDSKIFA